MVKTAALAAFGTSDAAPAERGATSRPNVQGGGNIQIHCKVVLKVIWRYYHIFLKSPRSQNFCEPCALNEVKKGCFIEGLQSKSNFSCSDIKPKLCTA